ncbi:hypothetical protein SELMODRAFT_95291, partial [Selaginella moellendorffii]
LVLFDLASSEHVAKTGAGGVRLKEGQHISKSLMTIGTVRNKLSEGPGKGNTFLLLASFFFHKGYIAYLDSKLMRIL